MKKWQGGKLAELTPELFQGLYFDQKKSLQDIADIYGVSRVAVYKWFTWNFKDQSTQLRPRKVSTRTLDSDFFETWSPEMAYVLGLFATDGCVKSKYAVVLTSTDLELIEKVKDLMHTDHPVRIHPPRGFSRKTQYMLEISSMALVSSLEKLGIGARKSRVIVFPEMPKECVRHFLRGCWDGDGSFYFEKRSHKLRASFVSGSRQFIKGFAHALKEFGICQWVLKHGHRIQPTGGISIYASNRGGHTSYSFRLSGENAIAFGGLIYDSVPETMYLKRKHEVFCMALSDATVQPEECSIDKVET